MQQGDIIRGFGVLAAAGVGAGLALGGAAVTGHLGGGTTIEQVAAAPAASSTRPTGTDTLSVAQIYRLDAPGVVQITGERRPAVASGVEVSEGLGSGFVIDKAGHIVTALSNLVPGATHRLRVSFSGNDELAATIVGKDPSTGVAVLQIKAHSRSLAPLPLGDSDDVQVGDQVVAIGNTAGLSRTATVGIVSAIQRDIDAPSGAPGPSDAIQTDAAINHSNSGGPLINAYGQVIGVSAELGSAVDEGESAGTGFAIPIDIVKSVVAQLIDTGKVEHPYLGVEAVPVTDSLASAFDLPSGSGLIVQSVRHGSAAAQAGLRAGTTAVIVAGESYQIGGDIGDIIVAANGAPIATVAQLREVIEAMKPGDRLALRIWRGRKESTGVVWKESTVVVTLGRSPGG